LTSSGSGDAVGQGGGALAELGLDEAVRSRLVAALVDYERLPAHRFTTVRDDVTGPIVDALHARVRLLRKELSNGLCFDFPYRSKIARDFVMAVPAKPDHVWEPQTTKLLVHLALRASDVIVGGAYFGDQAIVVADSLRGRGTCHAFEADAEQAAFLERNAALNGLDNLRVQSIGLWSDTSSRITLVGRDALGSPVLSDSGIPTTTIDAYVASAKISKLGVITLDLEGGELEALRGAERVLREHAPHVVLEIHRLYVDWSNGLHATEIGRYLTALGYALFAIRDFQSNVDLRDRPIELVPAQTVYLDGPPHGFNVLAVKDSRVIDDELFRVTPNVSPKLLWHRDPALHHPVGGM
jgi:FkbM family methyltransferase